MIEHLRKDLMEARDRLNQNPSNSFKRPSSRPPRDRSLDEDRETSEIDTLIREEVEKLGNKQGGFMMIHHLHPGVPLANVKALMDAMEKYASYYS